MEVTNCDLQFQSRFVGQSALHLEVICIHCPSGTACGEPPAQFTVSNVWAVDDSLPCQRRPWPDYRKVTEPDADADYFANHCPRCGAPRDDLYLHSDPDEPFFDVPRAPTGAIKLTPLTGTIRLSGDEHFEVQ